MKIEEQKLEELIKEEVLEYQLVRGKLNVSMQNLNKLEEMGVKLELGISVIHLGINILGIKIEITVKVKLLLHAVNKIIQIIPVHQKQTDNPRLLVE